jgi:UDP-glucuronate 4-epimerase
MVDFSTAVSGVTGLIGKAFFDRLHNSEKILGLTRQKGTRYYYTDYSRGDVDRLLAEHSQLTYVIHAAGKPAVFVSLKDPLADVENNFSPSLFSLDLARRSESTFVYISSGEVYGYRQNKIYHEYEQPCPANFYGLSKYCVEQYTSLYREKYNTDYIVLRPSVVFGPGMTRNILFDLLAQFRSGAKNIKLFTSLNSTFDFIHNEDLPRAFELIRNNKATNEIWNISSDEPIEVGDLFNWFCNRFNYKPTIEIVENNLQHKRISSSKLKSLGWMPLKNFSQNLEEVLKYD